MCSKHDITPSPAEYKIKSSFEIIAEQGKKISKNKKRIQLKEIQEIEKKQIKESPKILYDQKNNENEQLLDLNDDKDKEQINSNDSNNK